MTYKASPTGFKLYNTYSTIIEYTYRDYKYEVEYPNSITYCCTEPYIQHRDAQERIDKMIEEQHIKKEYKYEDSAEYGFELFWNYVNGEEK